MCDDTALATPKTIATALKDNTTQNQTRNLN